MFSNEWFSDWIVYLNFLWHFKTHMGHYQESLKLTLKQWLLGTCIFIKSHKFWILLVLTNIPWHKPMQEFPETFVFFLLFDNVVVSLLLLLFIFRIFAEFCWETRLLIFNLCPCDFFLSLVYLFVLFTCSFTLYLKVMMPCFGYL